MALRELMQGPWPVTAPTVLNPLMAKMVAPDWGPTEKAMLATIERERLLAVERATVEKGKR
jgi:hypothetical protein